MTSQLKVNVDDREVPLESLDAELKRVFHVWVARSQHDAPQRLASLVAESVMQEGALLEFAASLAARHHAFEGDETRLRSWLQLLAIQRDIAQKLGGEPYQVWHDVGQDLLTQARLQGEAIQTIWREPMLEPKTVAAALGAKATNREKVRQYRRRSWLLGLRTGRGYTYPAFQIDGERRDVFPEVRLVNVRLDAANDPWGVASWWVSGNARLGTRPLELVGTDRAEDIVTVAGTVTELVG